MPDAQCVWCGFDFRTPARNARFCSPAHRQNFHSACRSLGERMFREGAVTIEQLKAEQEPCTGQGVAE